MIVYALEHIGPPGLREVLIRARRAVENSGLVIYPTDTLYGLGASAHDEEGIARVFEAKGRPLSKPLSVAVADVDGIFEFADVEDEVLIRFIRGILPSRTTLLLPARTGIHEILTAGSGIIGLRVPDDRLCREILKVTGPLTSTSANLHGERQDRTCGELAEIPAMDRFVDMLLGSARLDSRLKKGRENPGSTILRVNGNRLDILRKGGMSPESVALAAKRWGMQLSME